MLKALEEENIKFDFISGTSSGSIVSALYGAGYKADEIFELFKKYCKKIKYVDGKNIFKFIYGIFVKQKIVINGFNSGTILEKIIKEACDAKQFYLIKDSRVPIIIPSVDLYTGAIYVFTSEEKRNKFSDECIYVNDIEIGKAVRASCSYPRDFLALSIPKYRIN